MTTELNREQAKLELEALSAAFTALYAVSDEPAETAYLTTAQYLNTAYGELVALDDNNGVDDDWQYTGRAVKLVSAAGGTLYWLMSVDETVPTFLRPAIQHVRQLLGGTYE
jgi:hypothetical protein